MSSDNKRDSVIIKKKNRKHKPNTCCHKQLGNKNKYNHIYCCSYPMVYKRKSTTCYNKTLCKCNDNNENNEINLNKLRDPINLFKKTHSGINYNFIEIQFN